MTEPITEQPVAGCIFMYRDGQRAEVNENSIEIMAGLGWSDKEKVASDAKPSDGLSVAALKDALAAKGITIPEGVTLKADLAALLDGAPTE